MKVETVLATKGPRVVTVAPAASITDAVAVLAEHHIGAVVVVDGSPRPVGILSERDIIRALVRGTDCLAARVSDLMTKDVICGTSADDVDAALRTMTSKFFRHLPIVDDDVLVGIVSIGDLVKAQLQQYEGDVDTLQTRLMSP